MLSKDGGEELGVDAGRLHIFDSDSYISGHTEVRVLVDTLWDKARNVGSLSEDMREGVGERGNGLDGWVGKLTAVVTLVDSEYTLELIWLELGDREILGCK